MSSTFQSSLIFLNLLHQAVAEDFRARSTLNNIPRFPDRIFIHRVIAQILTQTP
jgi:hypothetical protein